MIEVSKIKKGADQFTVIDDDGREILCNVLFTYDIAEARKRYIAYTDESRDEEGNIQVFASRLDWDGDGHGLIPIETQEEWHLIETILDEIQMGMRKHGVNTRKPLAGKLKSSFHASIGRLYRLRFPLRLALLYGIGVMALHALSWEPMPLWLSILFALPELCLIKLYQNAYTDTGNAAQWLIAGIPGFMALQCSIERIYQGVFPGPVHYFHVEPMSLARSVILAFYAINYIRCYGKR